MNLCLRPVTGAVLRLLVAAALFGATLPVLADEFDALRLKWRDMLTQSNTFNPTDPLYTNWVVQIGATADDYWSSMNTNAGRTSLWNKLNQLATDSSHVTSTYERLRAMALGYSVRGSSLEKSNRLASAITNALDWMHANHYNQTKSEFDNWFDWEIGTPLNLNDIIVLMYTNLTSVQVSNYTRAIERFSPNCDFIQNGTNPATGANRVWKALVVGLRGATVKDGSKLAAARNSLSNVFPYVATGDGFCTDGSFVFHDRFSYNGGYGAQLIETLGPLLQWLDGSTWQVTDPAQANLFNWIYDSFQPFIYQGALMQMVDGRYHTRRGDDHADGAGVINSILRIAQFAPLADATACKSMVKQWIQADTYQNFLQVQPPPYNVWAAAVMNDTNLAPCVELVRHFQFPCMDRVVHLRPGWGFGIASSSSRIANYESINGENLRGWYTGDGMNYLYNADLGHFADGFWPTVDPYRLPGTTVDSQSRADGSGEGALSPTNVNWVGGASLQDYGVSGLQLSAWNSTLSARKSWFLFDNEVICLGAGISSTDNRPIETIVENRRLAGYGNNAFTVNGGAKPVSVGWSETMTNTSWAHLRGTVPGADLGYFFPAPTMVKALREARSGSLSDLNTHSSTNVVTRNYLTLWLDHGVNPAGSNYAYVLLPNQTAAQVAAYAASPDIQIVANNTRAQAVREKILGITAVNFWKGATNIGGLTADAAASVILRNDGAILEVGLSDPTQVNTGLINLEISNVTAVASLFADPGVTILQTIPSIKLAINVAGASGRTFRARFFVGPAQTVTLAPVADAHVQDGTQAAANFGNAATLAVKTSATATQSREAFLRFDLAQASGLVLDAKLRLVAATLNEPINHAVALVTNNVWTENGLTWNNKPASGPGFANWLVSSTDSPILVPVTALVQQAASTNGNLSLRIYSAGTPPSTNGGFTSYVSKENGAMANWPQLILTLGRRPPAIAITSPAEGEVFDAPAAVSLSANAGDSDGSVVAVQYFSGSTRIAQVSNAPAYRLTLTNLAVGPYNITAVALDNSGLMSTSAPVSYSVLTPEPAGLGTGLVGEYYTTSNLIGLALSRIDPTVDFSWGAGSPDPGIVPDHFSVRWTGRLQTRRGGVHLFHTVSDEGVRLWINGQLLIDDWIGHYQKEDSASVSLSPGQYYDISMEYFENSGAASAHLFWTEPGGTREIIPQTQFYPADSGLRGAYYAGTNFTKLMFTRVDDTVNFAWGGSSPDPALLPAGFSVLWEGRVRANQTGAHTFFTRSDDGVRLWVDNRLVISNWAAHAVTEDVSAPVMLVAGQWYNVKMEFFDGNGGAVAMLLWAPPGESKQIIPRANFVPKTPHQNNNPPALAAVPNLVVVRSNLLAFPVAAADSDVPPQPLAFTLAPGAPAGASITSGGVFSWTPSPTQALGNYNVTVRVTDSGVPVMTDAQTFTITVTSPLVIAASGNGISIHWPVEAGLLKIYSTTNLTPPALWLPVTNAPVLSAGQWRVALPTGTNRSQFFRLQAQ